MRDNWILLISQSKNLGKALLYEIQLNAGITPDSDKKVITSVVSPYLTIIERVWQTQLCITISLLLCPLPLIPVLNKILNRTRAYVLCYKTKLRNVSYSSDECPSRASGLATPLLHTLICTVFVENVEKAQLEIICCFRRGTRSQKQVWGL